jgi:spermidine/putrescine transport system substrate-binding protein
MTVTYSEVIEDNAAFYQRLLPSLTAHDNTGYDLIVMTNNSIELSYLIQGGWLVPLDQSAMVKFNKYAATSVKNPAWDKGNKYTMAWQSGWTTVAYDKNEISKVSGGLNVLFDKRYRGKIGMLSDPIELGSLGLLAIGVNPATSTPSDWAKAATKLRRQRDDGIVAAYYGNDYIGHLKNGDLVASQAYSGDIFQANLAGSKNLVLMTPKQGIMFWTDNLCIPLYAANPRDAMVAMDYFYDPQVQSVLEYFIDYACPVPSAKNELLQPTGWNKATLAAMKREVGTSPSVTAASPQVFPTSVMVKASKTYYQFKSQKEIDTWNGYFLPIVQGA